MKINLSPSVIGYIRVFLWIGAAFLSYFWFTVLSSVILVNTFVFTMLWLIITTIVSLIVDLIKDLPVKVMFITVAKISGIMFSFYLCLRLLEDIGLGNYIACIFALAILVVGSRVEYRRIITEKKNGASPTA